MRKRAEKVGCTIVVTAKGFIAFRVRWCPAGGVKKRYQFTTKTPATSEELKRAKITASEIGGRVTLGTFNPHDYFEITPRFGAAGPSKPVLEDSRLETRMADWIEDRFKRKVRSSRLKDYEKHLRNYFSKHAIGQLNPLALTREELSDFQVWMVSGAGQAGEGVSEKTASNVLRGTLRAFLRDIDADLSLTALGKIRWERYEPQRQQEPLSQEERDRVLRWFRERRNVSEYVSLLLRFSGITPSEVRGLQVGDVSRASGSVTIRRSTSENLRDTGATKTSARQRTVFLEAHAAAELAEVCSIRPLEEPIFHLYESTFTKTWATCLRSLGIRHRSIYQAKHTYATLALLSGESPAIVANHLGIGLGTLQKHYAHALQTGRVRPAARGVSNGN
jgi:integrase